MGRRQGGLGTETVWDSVGCLVEVGDVAAGAHEQVVG